MTVNVSSCRFRMKKSCRTPDLHYPQRFARRVRSNGSNGVAVSLSRPDVYTVFEDAGQKRRNRGCEIREWTARDRPACDR